MHTNRRGWEIMILGALDVAIWDIYGQMLNKPVWKLLGGAQRGPFQSTVGSNVEVIPYCTLVSDVWGGEQMFLQQEQVLAGVRPGETAAFVAGAAVPQHDSNELTPPGWARQIRFGVGAVGLVSCIGIFV